MTVDPLPTEIPAPTSSSGDETPSPRFHTPSLTRPPPPADARYVAQIAATSMIRILGFGFHFTPAKIVAWWNDVIAMIEVVLVSSEIDPYVVFGCLALLQRYATSTEKPVETLDTYRLFIASLMVATKILCPRKQVSWTCILGESFVKESVNWMEREFLITVEWDEWMMEIVEDVWEAYDQAVAGRKGDPGSTGRVNRASAFSWISSATSSRTGDTSDSGGSPNPSILFPTPLVLSTLKRGPSGLASLKTRDRSTSAFWRDYGPREGEGKGSNGGGVGDSSSDSIESPLVSPALSLGKKEQPGKTLRTRVSKIFRSNSPHYCDAKISPQRPLFLVAASTMVLAIDPFTLYASEQRAQSDKGPSLGTLNPNKDNLACCLPPEILLKIFSIRAKEPKTLCGFTLLRSHPIIPITHVCRSWRSIALGCGELWSDLSYLAPLTMAMSFKRSGRSPLTFTHDCRKHPFTDVVIRILTETERLESLDLDECSPAILHQSLRLLSTRAPLLKDLCISCAPDDSSQMDVFPEDFLKDGAPLLERLGIERCNIPWKKIPFSRALIKLFLLNDLRMPRCRGSWDHLLQVLEDAPGIQVLHLFLVLPREKFSPKLGVHSPVMLPSLRELKLHDPFNLICDFFAACSFDKIESLMLVFDNHALDVNSLGRAFASLRSAWCNGPRVDPSDTVNLSPRVEKLEIMGSDCIDVDAYMPETYMSFNFQLTRPGSDKKEYPRFLFHHPSVPPNTVLAALASEYSALTTFTTLELSYGPTIGEQGWRALKAAKSLKTIKFNEAKGASSVASLFRTLAEPRDVGSDASNAVPFASLALVECSYLDDWGDHHASICSAVKKAAKARSDAGIRGLKLDITGCGHRYAFRGLIGVSPAIVLGGEWGEMVARYDSDEYDDEGDSAEYDEDEEYDEDNSEEDDEDGEEDEDEDDDEEQEETNED